MTVTNVPPVNVVVSTALQTVFPFSFPILNATDFKAYITPVGVDPLTTRTSIASNTYTLVINGDNIGGTMTLNVGAALGSIIVMRRDMPDERTTTFTNITPFQGDSVNREWDTDVLLVQQNSYAALNMSLRYDYNVLGSITLTKDMFMPLLGASQSFRKNAANTSLEAFTPAEALELKQSGLVSIHTDGTKSTVHVPIATPTHMSVGGNSSAVTPDNLQHCPFTIGCILYKTPTETLYRNCASSHVGIGLYTITFSTPALSNRYLVQGMASGEIIDPMLPATWGSIVAFNKTTTGFSFYTMAANNQRRDFENVELSVSGIGAFDY
jgi:hypothetical protein